MDSSQKFRVVLPAEIQKSDSGEWRVFGLASTPNRDLQGEVIDLKGIDLDPIKKGKGVFNWDHGTGPENTIGAIDTYKKADEGLYLGGYLFKEHDRAKSIFQIMSSLKKSDRGRIGMSVEGIIKKRSGEDGKVISKATITKCALTMNPVNTDTYADLVKSLSASEVEFDADAIDDDGSFDSTTLEKAEGERGGHIIGHTAGGKPIYGSARHPAHSDFKPHEHLQAEEAHSKEIAGIDAVRADHFKHEIKGHQSRLKRERDYHLSQQREHRTKTGTTETGDGVTRFRDHANEPDWSHVEKKQVPKMEKSLGVGAAQATTLPQNISGGDALAHEDFDHKKEKHCEKCMKSMELCKCSKEMKKGSEAFYKSLLCDLMDQLGHLYPNADKGELWEAVKDRLNRKFPSLNIG